MRLADVGPVLDRPARLELQGAEQPFGGEAGAEVVAPRALGQDSKLAVQLPLPAVRGVALPSGDGEHRDEVVLLVGRAARGEPKSVAGRERVQPLLAGVES